MKKPGRRVSPSSKREAERKAAQLSAAIFKQVVIRKREAERKAAQLSAAKAKDRYKAKIEEVIRKEREK